MHEGKTYGPPIDKKWGNPYIGGELTLGHPTEKRDRRPTNVTHRETSTKGSVYDLEVEVSPCLVGTSGALSI